MYYVLWVWVCLQPELSRIQKARAVICHLWLVRPYRNFSHHLINSTTTGKKLLNINVYIDFCTTFFLNIFLHKKNSVNRCLRYILRIWWPNIISNKDLWKATRQEDINLEIRKRKFRWIGHTLRKEYGEITKAALHWNPLGNRKRGRPKNSWRRSVIKEAGRSWNELRFLAAERSGKDS